MGMFGSRPYGARGMLKSERQSRDNQMKEMEESARQRRRLSSQEDIAEMRQRGETRRAEMLAESKLMPAEVPAWRKRMPGYRGPSKAREPIEIAKQRMVGEQGMAERRLMGEQAEQTGTSAFQRGWAEDRQKAVEKANLETMRRGHEMSKFEMGQWGRERESGAGPTDWKSFQEEMPGKMGQKRTGFFSPSTGQTQYPGRQQGGMVAQQEQGMEARAGGQPVDFSQMGKPTLSKLWGMKRGDQEQYMAWLEKNDPEGYKSLGNELSMLRNPQGERPSEQNPSNVPPPVFGEEEEYGPSTIYEQRKQGRGSLYTNY